MSETHSISVSSEFVGRDAEMAELKAALDDAHAGQGRIVMLVGDRGIGKTRTAEELGAVAQTQGAEVLWGRCYEGEGQPPYWPWVQAIRTYTERTDAQQLLKELGTGASSIAEIIPDIWMKLSDVERPPPVESGHARFRLFDSMTTFLRAASQVRPLVLILDNLNWADRESLLLLEFLSEELGRTRLLVVGTYWDFDLSRGHPLSQTLGELTRHRLFRRIALRGLSLEDVGRYIRTVSRVEVPEGLTEVVHSHAEGNPLFVTEVVRMLQEEGGLTQGLGGTSYEWSARIPDGVKEVIGRRLSCLSDRCNEILTVASVIGRQFHLDPLRQLITDTSEEELLGVLEEAVSARILDEIPREVGRYQFSLGLVQGTLLDETSTTRRVRLHARIAEVLEELHGERVADYATELVHHCYESMVVTGPEKLIKYSIAAGEQALSAHAYEDALVHFQRGVTALEGQTPGDLQTAALFYGLGRAQAAVYREVEAFQSLKTAFDVFVQIGELAEAVSAAVYPLALYGWRDLTRHLARALELTPPDSVEAGRVLSRYGMALYWDQHDYAGAREAFTQALSIARRERDATLEMWTLERFGEIDLEELHLQQSTDRQLAAVTLADMAADLSAQVDTHYHAAQVLVIRGRLDEAVRHAAQSAKAADRLRDRFRQVQAWEINLTAAILKGDWETARGWHDHLMAHVPHRTEVPVRSIVALMRPEALCACRAFLECESGNRDDARNWLNRAMDVLAEDSATLPFCLLAMIRAATELNESGRVEQIERTMAQVTSRDWEIPLIALNVKAALGLLAASKAESASASEHYLALRPHQGTMGGVRWGGVPTAIDRVLGLLARAIGRPAEAIDHFEDALGFCRDAGYEPELAWTYYDYAETLLERDGPGDPEKSVALVDTALGVASRLGMRHLSERIAALRERAESVPATTPAYPDGLTEREVAVLRLIASGKTNRQIAEELVISLNTVFRHVSNIFSKTGASNRTEAATYAHQKSLVESGD